MINGKCCVGRVEAVGPVNDETHRRLRPSCYGLLIQSEPLRAYVVLALCDRLSSCDEGLQTATRCPGASTVEQLSGLLFGEDASEDFSKSVFERISPP